MIYSNRYILPQAESLFHVEEEAVSLKYVGETAILHETLDIYKIL